MIEQGLATVQTPYTEEEKSAIYEELKLAEAEAIAKKRDNTVMQTIHMQNLMIFRTIKT